MGCINSKKDIKDVHSNIFHVINIDNEGTELWSGKLEVTRVELTLYRKGKEPTKWPLKCLRRYGYNVDQFSFEAGRRCTTGEGIYAFRCRRAEALFYTVQAYIQGRIYSDENTNPNDPYPIPVASNGPSVAARSVSQNNTATRSSGSGGGQGQQMQCTFVMNRTGMATSQSLSPNGTIHSNSNQSRSTDTLPMEGNYLEPTPNRSNASGTGQPHTITTRFQQGLRLSSVSSGPISPDITSPGSPNSMTNILEVTTLNPLPTSHTSGNVHQGVSNVYQEFPMKDSTMASLHHQHHQLLLHQHHVHHPVVAPIVTPLVGGLVRNSMDVPPQEPAPGASVLLNSSIATDIIPVAGSSGPTDTLICGSEYDQQQPSTPDAIDPARLYMNVNITCSDVGSGGMTGCGKPKKPATFSSKSNSSLISISNINNNNSTNGGHNSTGSFDECQYQNVRTPTSITAIGGVCGAGMPLLPQNIVTGNMFAQFQRLNSAGGGPGQFSMDPNRFYENLELAELKAVSLRGRCSKPDIFSNVDLPLDHSEPCTPTATAANQRKVNYIVLDLDQSNSSHSIAGAAGPGANGTGILSPTGTVPGGMTNGNTIAGGVTSSANNFNNNNNNNNNNSTAINLNSVATGVGMCNSASGMALGSIATGPDHRSSSVSGISTNCGTGLCGGTPTNPSAGNVPPTSLGLLPPESPKKASLGYATIDFNKTVALSNSTTPSSELDSEGSRKTRHNSTVTPLARQSNSVSD